METEAKRVGNSKRKLASIEDTESLFVHDPHNNISWYADQEEEEPSNHNVFTENFSLA